MRADETDRVRGHGVMFVLGAFALVFDRAGRVLLCHRRDMDMWDLPGGQVESGELPTQTVVRETREETGLEVKVEQLVGVYGKPARDELVFAFRCRVVGGELTPSDETDECRYFAIEQTPANLLPKHVARIHDALRADSAPVFRWHAGPSTREVWQGRSRPGPNESS
jgi:ADP-ribose pyrophosphatase YjhB (NUDIX family)